MPALRVIPVTLADLKAYVPSVPVADSLSAVDKSICDVKFPLPETREREMYRTNDGKKVSDHAWAVYDYIRTIPVGKVVTYKDVAVALGEGSPRTVGGALRRNPFAPRAPCHRVIASNLFIGGFMGDWGKNTKDTKGKPVVVKEKSNCDKKLDLLAEEGVAFDDKGMLKNRSYLWNGVST